MFSFESAELEMHENLMPCVIFGRSQSVKITDGVDTTEAEIICIKPNTPHRVSIGQSGAEIVYFDGVSLPEKWPAFSEIDNSWASVPDAVKENDITAIDKFRRALEGVRPHPDPAVLEIVERLYTSTMDRLSQDELSNELGLERTQALRHFKANTGQTFRKFKKWASSVSTVHDVYNGKKIGAAGIDAGFSDAAHVARTARAVFGVTPTSGMESLTRIRSV
jgi:AraC-like DNA-binding protein